MNTAALANIKSNIDALLRDVNKKHEQLQQARLAGQTGGARKSTKTSTRKRTARKRTERKRTARKRTTRKRTTKRH